MIIKTLVENTSNAQGINGEHGLSLYIETKKHKLLFDLGQKDLFLDNAKQMNVDIADIDLVVISHGHYDHGGGLGMFFEHNDKALVYTQESAFANYYAKRPQKTATHIGLDAQLKNNHRIRLVKDYLRIDDELQLFSNVQARNLISSINEVLFRQEENHLVQDSFAHEQNLLITSDETSVLVAGCAHSGIINILKTANKIHPQSIDYVVGGFHLFDNTAKRSEDPKRVRQIGEFLSLTNSQYYTGHCTGLEPFTILQNIMKDQIQYMATGTVMEI